MFKTSACILGFGHIFKQSFLTLHPTLSPWSPCSQHQNWQFPTSKTIISPTLTPSSPFDPLAHYTTHLLSPSVLANTGFVMIPLESSRPQVIGPNANVRHRNKKFKSSKRKSKFQIGKKDSQIFNKNIFIFVLSA